MAVSRFGVKKAAVSMSSCTQVIRSASCRLCAVTCQYGCSVPGNAHNGGDDAMHCNCYARLCCAVLGCAVRAALFCAVLGVLRCVVHAALCRACRAVSCMLRCAVRAALCRACCAVPCVLRCACCAVICLQMHGCGECRQPPCVMCRPQGTIG